MRALLSRDPGGPETLKLVETAEPAVTPETALIDIKACGVNFPDVLMIEDKHQYRPPRPFAPGGEIAGVVRAVGARVTEVQPGDRVMGLCFHGGMAEAVAIEEKQLFRIPDEMPFDDAAALLLTFGTSHHALKDRAALAPGETLLVLGAAGGVGLAAVMIGKAMGARVIGAASTEEKAELAARFGADATLVYPTGSLDRAEQKALADRFKTACAPGGADIVYDVVGGDYAEPALRSIAFEGRYLVVGFATGRIPSIPLNLPLLKACQIAGVFWGAWFERHPDKHRQNVAELIALYVQGKVKPYISERIPLDCGARALERLASREALGKIVVVVG